jgi:hypothetical protein
MIQVLGSTEVEHLTRNLKDKGSNPHWHWEDNMVDGVNGEASYVNITLDGCILVKSWCSLFFSGNGIM